MDAALALAQSVRTMVAAMLSKAMLNGCKIRNDLIGTNVMDAPEWSKSGAPVHTPDFIFHQTGR
jgi:hypothetical protein